MHTSTRLHGTRRQATAALLATFAALLLGAAPLAADAQAYPSKPIRFLVPSPPGGGTDALTRLVAGKLGETLQWSFVIDNRPGAGGNLGMDVAAKAEPDGYTIVMGESSNLTINPALYRKMPFDPATDLVPVAFVGTVPLVLVVAADSPYTSLAALTAAGKSRQLTLASSGNGTVGHLVGETWKRAAGVDALHVPYKGAGPVMTDLIGHQVDLHFASLPAGLPLIKSGKLRALAVTAPQRLASLPDVPTLIESGYRDFDYRVLYGVLAPRGTPPAIVERLHDEIARALQQPDLRAALAARGVDPQPGSASQFGAYLDGERRKWAKAVKESGATVD